MEPSSLPWDKGISAVFGTALLLIFLDFTYRKFPRGMGSVRKELKTQTAALTDNHKIDQATLQALVVSIERLDTAVATLLQRQKKLAKARGQRRPRRKKSTGPAGR